MTIADYLTRRGVRRSHYLYSLAHDTAQIAAEQRQRADLRAAALDLRRTGASHRAIADDLGCSASLVRTLLREAAGGDIEIY